MAPVGEEVVAVAGNTNMNSDNIKKRRLIACGACACSVGGSGGGGGAGGGLGGAGGSGSYPGGTGSPGTFTGGGAGAKNPEEATAAGMGLILAGNDRAEGGAGGGLGSSGTSGTVSWRGNYGGGGGGAAGTAIVGNGNINWITTGTRYGSIT